MVRFLGAAWLAALSAALHAADVTSEGAPPLVIQQVVERPGGETVGFRVRLDAAGAEALPGTADDATVTYRQSYEVARGIATGELDAHVEFLMGRVVVTGDTQALVDYRAPLERMHAALRDLGSITEF